MRNEILAKVLIDRIIDVNCTSLADYKCLKEIEDQYKDDDLFLGKLVDELVRNERLREAKLF